MNSALQQALQNIKNVKNFAPSNIKTQAKAVLPLIGQSFANAVDNMIQKGKGMPSAGEAIAQKWGTPGMYSEKPLYPGVQGERTSRKIKAEITPTPTATSTLVPTRIPTATPTPIPGEPTRDELIEAIKRGSKGSPIGDYAQMIVDEQMKYPIYKKYPFLTVSQSHLESRGLKDFKEQPNLVYKPKQALGWGVFVPTYNPKTIDEAIQDYISAIGGRTAEAGFDEGQIHNSMIYQPFREGGDLKWFANKYAGPITKQNPNAGDIYASNLASVMNEYAAVLDELMKKRGSGYGNRY